MENRIYVEKSTIWKPDSQNPSSSPKLEYVDSLFRRRLSQISKMTIEVVHAICEKGEDLPLVFASFRGEISRQFKINRGIVEENEVSPAQFSLSTFNAPPATASIALNLKSGYVALYCKDFSDALLAARARVLANGRIFFVFADEKIPDEYESASGKIENEAFAFAVLLSSEEKSGAKPIDFSRFKTLKEFLQFLEDKI